jgi:hypothetical protein
MRVLPRHLPLEIPRVPFSSYQGLISRAPTRYPNRTTPDEADEGE